LAKDCGVLRISDPGEIYQRPQTPGPQTTFGKLFSDISRFFFNLNPNNIEKGSFL
jgi:hypothetical protein